VAKIAIVAVPIAQSIKHANSRLSNQICIDESGPARGRQPARRA
jgi:hypothetical protein